MKRAALIAGISILAVCGRPDQRSGLDWRPRLMVARLPAGSALQPAVSTTRPAAGAKARAARSQDRQDAGRSAGAPPHHRLDRQTARDAVRRRQCRSPAPQFPQAPPSHPTPMGVFTHHPEKPPSRLQSLQRADALHAAHHMVGLRAARRAPARLSGVARLRPSDRRLCAIAVEGDQDGRAGHRHAPRGRAASRSSTPACSCRSRRWSRRRHCPSLSLLFLR